MNNTTTENSYRKNLQLVSTAALIILGLWFAYEIISILFLFFFAVVLTLVLNAPTMWLVARKVPRTVAALIVFFTMLIFLLFLAKMVIPRILEQVSALIASLPGYYIELKKEIAAQLEDYPSLQQKVLAGANLEDTLPSVENMLASASRFSFSIIGIIFLLIVFFSIVAYMLINPAPLIETYLLLFSTEKRPKAAIALASASRMMVGWMWSNLVIGFLDAVAVFVFLNYMGVPGIWVWATLALFASMVPRLGMYIMATPPILITLTTDPIKALWLLVFYLILDEITGDFILPRIRASTMKLHPVSTLFVMLIMAGAFGLAGALIATPLTAFIKAYYETFYLSSASKVNLQEQVEIVLKRKTT